MIKVLELFGGIGACSKALERLKIDYEIADYVEIDKYAVKSFNAIHNTNFEPQDIRKWDKDIKVDLIMHGSPCQDFSLAGKGAGGDKDSGTRSSLMYETIRIVEKLKPKYVIWENVKNLLSKKHRHNFDAYLETMEQLGYINHYQVLNAKDYGIPQNRERVFTISILNTAQNTAQNTAELQSFKFPPKQELKLKLKDMLEDEVDEKYYLSDKMIKYISANNEKWTGNNDKSIINKTIASAINTGEGQRRCDASNYINDNQEDDIDLKEVVRKYGIFDTVKSKHQAGSVYDQRGISPTLDTMQGGWRQPCIEIKNATKKGYLEAYEGDGCYISNIDKKRGTVQKGMIPTLKTSLDIGVVVKNTNNIQTVEIPQTVKVRKYEVDIERLKETLKKHKNYTNKEIALILDVPLTTVEHWFRNDNCFSIPDQDIWYKLKTLLKISTNEFDESITTFEEREGVYEKSNRYYLDTGIAPTLTNSSANEKIIVGGNNE